MAFLTFSEPMAQESGQQSFLNLELYQIAKTDVPSIWALESSGLEGRRFPDPRCWSELVARVAFTNLCRKYLDDEEGAYAELIDQGCPLSLADKAWDVYQARVAAGHIL